VRRVDFLARFPRRNIIWADLRWAVGAVRVKLVLGAERGAWSALDFAVFAHFPEAERSDVDQFSSLEQIAVGDRVDAAVALGPERISVLISSPVISVELSIDKEEEDISENGNLHNRARLSADFGLVIWISGHPDSVVFPRKTLVDQEPHGDGKGDDEEVASSLTLCEVFVLVVARFSDVLVVSSDVPVSGSVSVLLSESLPLEAAELAFAARKNLVVLDSLTDVRSSEAEEWSCVEVVSVFWNWKLFFVDLRFRVFQITSSQFPGSRSSESLGVKKMSSSFENGVVVNDVAESTGLLERHLRVRRISGQNRATQLSPFQHSVRQSKSDSKMG